MDKRTGNIAPINPIISVATVMIPSIAFGILELPDVVILDLELHLGGGNGLEYLSDLKQLKLVHRPLVIVTTNNTSKIVLDTARDLGAAMILTKYEQDYSATYVLKTISLMQNTLKTSSTSDLNLSTLSPADREHHIRTYLHSQLNLLGVSPKYKGYDYLIDAILLLSQNPHALIGKELSDKYRTISEYRGCLRLCCSN